MRLIHSALVIVLLAGVAGCNDTLDSFDPSKISNKVEQPLPSKILKEIAEKGMDRNSPIMIRILKEEGVLEVWKEKRNKRFEKITDYQICAWSGRLGPKKKEGDRQAPEGFYSLSPYNLNPNSKYYLAINTGFPNRFDQANGRTGSNLMIHGACSSSGCYSMTDAQILEIYAFARDAFKGGQTTIQLQAFPFRMTADNMARHRLSSNYDFWKMLKTGYDQFELTKRPPDVNVCERRYVFNQQPDASVSFSAAGACPPMSTPPALASAMQSYETAYAKDYDKALKKYDDKVWYDPTEAERKAIVAKERRKNDLAYAPTGSALKAGRLVSIEEFEKIQTGGTSAPQPAAAATPAPAAASTAETAQPADSAIPVPTPDPRDPQVAQQAAPPQPEATAKKPFWKLWN
ncbi:L,D-transpeptidase family protein [Rhizobium halophytocola]|uniref:Murein L,D-transpeptidase YafK n=1 Tax=Rhizobium halophytocola TaxID=735519 RepID=A0ABS4E2Q3_9HYPH|nr:murein L,D-transpeptidase family protein [Rhizobium halophytocola]MBP1852201.1 murein L,D-transpeptidase YafK [Rhizobium halophytocola]